MSTSLFPGDRWVYTLVSVGRDLSILPTGKRGLCWYTLPDNYKFTPEDWSHILLGPGLFSGAFAVSFRGTVILVEIPCETSYLENGLPQGLVLGFQNVKPSSWRFFLHPSVGGVNPTCSLLATQISSVSLKISLFGFQKGSRMIFQQHWMFRGCVHYYFCSSISRHLTRGVQLCRHRSKNSHPVSGKKDKKENLGMGDGVDK